MDPNSCRTIPLAPVVHHLTAVNCCQVAVRWRAVIGLRPQIEFTIGSGPGIRTLNLAVNRSLRPVQKWRSVFAECRRVPRFAMVCRRRCCTTPPTKASWKAPPRGSASTNKRQLNCWLARPSIAAASSNLEGEQDHFIHSPFELTNARTLKGLEDFARRGFELIPDVTRALQKERVTRVDHNRSDVTLNNCLAANRWIEWAHDDLAKSTTFGILCIRQSRRRCRTLELRHVSTSSWHTCLRPCSGGRKPWKRLLTFSELENLAEQPSHLLRGLQGGRRGWGQLVFREPFGDRREERVHSLLDRNPLSAVASEIALVHRQRDRRQVDLPHQAGHSRHLYRVRVSEELASSDQPAELVAAQTGYVIDAAPFRLGEAVPTADGRTRRSDREAMLLLEVDR